MVDTLYIKLLKENHLNHLRSTDEQGENSPKKVLDKAGSAIGALSRLYDSLSLQTLDIEQYKKEVQSAGSVEAYMLQNLTEIATFMLNGDKTGLHPEVIKAMGAETYAKIVRGEVNANGDVVPKAGDEVAFKQREQEVAAQVMTSVIMSYLAGLTRQLPSKELKELLDSLAHEKEALKKAQSSLTQDWDQGITPEVNSPENKAELTTRAAAFLARANKTMAMDELVQVTTLHDTVRQLQGKMDLPFHNAVTSPINLFMQAFSLTKLKQPPTPEATIDPQEKVNRIMQNIAALKNLLKTLAIPGLADQLDALSMQYDRGVQKNDLPEALLNRVSVNYDRMLKSVVNQGDIAAIPNNPENKTLLDDLEVLKKAQTPNQRVLNDLEKLKAAFTQAKKSLEAEVPKLSGANKNTATTLGHVNAALPEITVLVDKCKQIISDVSSAIHANQVDPVQLKQINQLKELVENSTDRLVRRVARERDESIEAASGIMARFSSDKQTAKTGVEAAYTVCEGVTQAIMNTKLMKTTGLQLQKDYGPIATPSASSSSSSTATAPAATTLDFRRQQPKTPVVDNNDNDKEQGPGM